MPENRKPNPAQQRRSKVIAAILEQQGLIEDQQRQIISQRQEIATLRQGMAHMAIAAGVGKHAAFAPIVRAAGLQHLADSAQNPEGAPAKTTEEAAKPQATDDVNNVGAAPGEVNKDVTPEAVTDVNNSNVAANPPVLDHLEDVTKPTSGTDAPTPDAGDAESASRVTVGNPSNEAFDKPGDSGWKSTSSQQAEQDRFVTALRLARLRIHAGVANGEDLSLAQALASSPVSTKEMQAEASGLAAVASRGPQQREARHRGLVPRSAPGAGAAPSMQSQASGPAVSASDDEWGFGMDDISG